MCVILSITYLDTGEPREAKMKLPFLGFCFFLAVFLLQIPKEQCADIIGGHESPKYSRPYMAVIMCGTSNEPDCGGTLIKPNWVLTAAHCCEQPEETAPLIPGPANFSSSAASTGPHRKQAKKVTVILGVHSVTEPGRFEQTFLATKQIRYPRYDRNTYEHDLMLLKLDRAAVINRIVRPINLPKTYADIKPGTPCLVAGWGSYTQNGMGTSDVLREVIVTIIDRRICNDKEHYNNNPVITQNMVCAGSRRGGKDSCHGDSGGPLICRGEQKGIVSFGKPGKCGYPQYPGVYTLLTKSHLDWIMIMTKGHL
uniref:Peptidase S1 domain-containing protein n=1 Tax=Salvator merianae TaxID=96440 RepID=A0A8D0E0F3_SALMN